MTQNPEERLNLSSKANHSPHFSLPLMDSTKLDEEVSEEYLPFFRINKNGRIERLMGTQTTPPSIDSHPSISSRDITISPKTGLSARIYLSKNNIETHCKLPLLIYFHGGGFCVESPFSPIYHNYANSLSEKANIIVISVAYRLAPEHPLPTAYEDSWAAIKWVASHSTQDGPERWITDYGDFNRLFLAGDSAGGNICHHMAMRAGQEEMGLNLVGIILANPYFWGKDRIGTEESDPEKRVFVKDLDKLWVCLCPKTVGLDDPLINPVGEEAPSLDGLGCRKVLVCVSERDALRDRGWVYFESLTKSGWDGVGEIMETMGEDHVFHMFKPDSEKAVAVMNRVVSFLNKDDE